MTNEKRQNFIKKIMRMIEVSQAEISDDLFNHEEKQQQLLIISQQQRLLDLMNKNNSISTL